MSHFTFKQVAAVALGCVASGCAHPAGVEGLRVNVKVVFPGKSVSEREMLYWGNPWEEAKKWVAEKKADNYWAALKFAHVLETAASQLFDMQPKVYAARLREEQDVQLRYTEALQKYTDAFADEGLYSSLSERGHILKETKRELREAKCQRMVWEVDVYSVLKHSPAEFLEGLNEIEIDGKTVKLTIDSIAHHKWNLKKEMSDRNCSSWMRFLHSVARKLNKWEARQSVEDVLFSLPEGEAETIGKPAAPASDYGTSSESSSRAPSPVEKEINNLRKSLVRAVDMLSSDLDDALLRWDV